MDHSELRSRFTDIKLAQFETGQAFERITFKFDGVPYSGELRGRNQDLCVGVNQEADRAIALRVFLDGDAQQQEETGTQEN